MTIVNKNGLAFLIRYMRTTNYHNQQNSNNFILIRSILNKSLELGVSRFWLAGTLLGLLKFFAKQIDIFELKRSIRRRKPLNEIPFYV